MHPRSPGVGKEPEEASAPQAASTGPAGGGLRFYGRSFCVDPNGDPVVESAGEEGNVLITQVDLERVRWVGRQWPFLRERRPEAYA